MIAVSKHQVLSIGWDCRLNDIRNSAFQKLLYLDDKYHIYFYTFFNKYTLTILEPGIIATPIERVIEGVPSAKFTANDQLC
jgi:hypothetical protein